jgi:hypothetical protein
MADAKVEKEKYDGEKVEVVGENYEAGKPEGGYKWRGKLRDRKEMMAYLKTGERYWFSDDWYGSERRRTKA